MKSTRENNIVLLDGEIILSEEDKLIQLINSEKIIEIIESKNHLELAKYIGKELCQFTKEDEKYVDIFWDAAFNKSWLYVSEEIVNEQFGYKNGKNMMSDFYDKLNKDYECNIDYKEVNKDHILVKFYSGIIRNRKVSGNRKKYYIITGETYKGLLASAQTKQGKSTRKYFIKIEHLANITNKTIFTYMQNIKEIQLKEKDKYIEQKEQEFNRLHHINAELLTYKKLLEKNESIYLVSTHNYITKGLIKVGRTKNIKARNSGHNTTHPKGDKVKILYEFKVNDSILLESLIHKKLAGLRPDKGSEFFMCPYDLLYDIIDMIINYDDEENKAVNKLIDAVFKLKQKEYKYLDWTSGLDMSIFEDNMKLIENITNEEGDDIEVKRAEFNITTATQEQKDAFIRDCMLAYQKNILLPQKLTILVWSTFQSHLIKELNIPKSKFKALEWRQSFKEIADEEDISIKLRGI